MRNLYCALAALAVAGAPLAAQTPVRDTTVASGPTPVLSLDEAQTLARRNNPEYLRAANDRRVASAQLRTARSALIPNVDANVGGQYREGRQQLVNGVPFGAALDVVSSSYSISAQTLISPSTFITPKLQRANLEAVEADITNTGEQLRATIAQQYLTALQQEARAALADTLVLSTRAQFELARAREAVGAGTSLDTKRAEVAVGQQQVAAIQAHNLAEVEKLRLFEQMGVQQPPQVRLTTAFAITQPSFSLNDVLDMARRGNPTLASFRSRERVAALGYRNAQSQYMPTLGLYTQWGGFTQQFTSTSTLVEQGRLGVVQEQRSCQTQQAFYRDQLGLPNANLGCDQIVFTPAQEAQIRSSNRGFPFSFERQPWLLSAQLSLPLFNGFQREQRIQEAAASRADAQQIVRAQELRLTAGVTSAYLTLTAAVRTAAINEQNAATAREALNLAQERYRVGAANFVDVAQARAEF